LKLREQFARDRRNVFDAGHRQQNALESAVVVVVFELAEQPQ
jgi:hypothetical protein